MVSKMARVGHGSARIILCVLALSSILVIATLAAPRTFASAQTIPAAWLRNSDGTLDLTRGVNGTIDLHGWHVTLDAKRGPILMPGRNAAPAAAWNALPGNGMSCCDVNAMAVYNNDLYVGGRFSATQDNSVTNLNNIARFSGNKWHRLAGEGLNGQVTALTSFAGYLFVGGTFTGTATGSKSNFNNIARYNGKWKTVPHGGLDGTPLVFLDRNGPFISHLYIGGTFSKTADGKIAGLNHIADLVQDHYNRLHWHGFAHQGLNGYYVAGLALYGGNVYAGGSFTASADNNVLNLNYIAEYAKGAWYPLSNNGLSYQVYALTAFKGSLYAGGDFTTSNDTLVPNLNHIARYKDNAWHALPGNGLNFDVRSFAVNGNDLYVGGDFYQTAAGGANLGSVAKYSGGAWSASGNGEYFGSVFALTLFGNDLYAGGNFGGPGVVSNEIARLKISVP